jgi:hypothetical protein
LEVVDDFMVHKAVMEDALFHAGNTTLSRGDVVEGEVVNDV